MTWVRLSDRTAGMEELNESGWDAQLLWYMTLTVCASVGEGAGNDGLLTPFMVRTTAALPSKPIPYRKAAPKLVAAGRWHDHVTVRSCADCMDHGGVRCEPGMFFIHEWWEHLLSAAGRHNPMVREHERRAKQLERRPEIRAMVRKRDRDRCRYCDVVTRWDGDRKSKHAGTYDHVDPFGGNNLDNLVVACKRCNGVKKDRTPEQAGMPLLPVPAAYQPSINPEISPDQPPESTPDQPHGPDSGVDISPRARETGRGLIGSDPDQPHGLDSGVDRHGLVLVGPALNGSNRNGNGNGNGSGHHDPDPDGVA